MTAESAQSFIREGKLIITESGSLDGAQASGLWIRGKPTEVTQ